MAKVSVNETPKDFSENSKKITESISSYIQSVLEICEEKEVDKVEVLNGVVSGVMTAVASYMGCPRCAGELMKDASDNLVASCDHTVDETIH